MSTLWNPPAEITEREERILKLCRKQKLWIFMRKYRHVIIDEDIRSELVKLYMASGRGRPPVAPEVLALAMLLQVAFGAADHEVPMLTAVDRRWQMVLDCLDAVEPLFSQGTVFSFRERARRHGLMQRMLDKTVTLARTTKGCSHKRLRAVFDASPLVGAGRVEDTFNLLGRAIGRLVEVAAAEAQCEVDALAQQLGLTVSLASSVKTALDLDWREPDARKAALQELLSQFRKLLQWLQAQFEQDKLTRQPMAGDIKMIKRIIEQDTEPDPNPPSESQSDSQARRIRKHDAKDHHSARDRLISLSDPDMRHGRKSKSKGFAGYKRHVAVDMDLPGLICDVEAQPANKREHEAAAPLLSRLEHRGFKLTQLHIDRGYLPSEQVVQRHNEGLDVISKPPAPAKSIHYNKHMFVTDFDARTLTCPAGVAVTLRLDKTTSFPSATCRTCHQRDACIGKKAARGRHIRLSPHEKWYRDMAAELATPEGRAKRRKRVQVEHALARIDAIQGGKARFRGLLKNQFDLQRAAVVNNCYVLDTLFAARQAA